MRRNFLAGLTLAFLLAVPSAALAEEIVYFTNGTTMAIVSHAIEGETIHVDLGSNAFIAFPARVVDRIEQAGNEVYISPSYKRSNVAASGNGRSDIKVSGGATPGGSRPITAAGQVPSRFRSADRDAQRFDAFLKHGGAVPLDDRHGVAVERPMASNPNRRMRGLSTPAGAFNDGSLLGTQRMGRHHVIDPKISANRRMMGGGPTSIGPAGTESDANWRSRYPDDTPPPPASDSDASSTSTPDSASSNGEN